jgi:uncharacterized protein
MVIDSKATARRFVLGRQGLWPGRRFTGRQAVERTIRSLTSIQVDPLDVIGHSQDLVLWGRIEGYRAAELEVALYRRRTVVEWGGNLQIWPVESMPYLRIVRQRLVGEDRWRRFARANASLIAKVLREVEDRGPLGGRDFEGASQTVRGTYRSGKLATQVLYYLWLKGDLVVESRRRGEKRYDLTSRWFPRAATEASVDESEEWHLLRTLRDLGLASESEWLAYAHGRIRRSTLRDGWKERVRRWHEAGLIDTTEVEGWPGRRWYVSDAGSELDALRAGDVPPGWRPVSTTTDEEVILLSPLEFVSARGRSTHLFDFELLCEFYKPAAKRRWGYYTLPVLWKDTLVARIDLRLDPSPRTIRVLGFWPDDPSVRKDRSFATALGRALARLAEFHAATELDSGALSAPAMERAVRTGFRTRAAA